MAQPASLLQLDQLKNEHFVRPDVAIVPIGADDSATVVTDDRS